MPYTPIKIDPLQAWVQTVIPTVYDDSLSYLEFLGKVLAKLNELITSDAAQSAALQEFLDTFEGDLTAVVTGYMDAWLADGTMDAILMAALTDFNEALDAHKTLVEGELAALETTLSGQITVVSDDLNDLQAAVLIYPILVSEVGVVDARYHYQDIRRYLGVAADQTVYIQNAIDSGNKIIHFPAGTYTFNLTLTTSYLTLKGEGERATIFKPYADADLITISSQANHVQHVTIKDVGMDQTDTFTLGCALHITAGGVPSTINDLHDFENIRITGGFRHNILVDGRLLFATFKRIESIGAIYDGLHVEVGDYFNMNRFIECQFGQNYHYGIYLKYTSGAGPIRDNVFELCNIYMNHNDTTDTYLSGVYVENVQVLKFANCWFEYNAQGQAQGRAIVIRGTYAENIDFDNVYMVGSTYAFDIDVTLGLFNIRNCKTGGQSTYKASHSDSKMTIDASQVNFTETINANGRTSRAGLHPLVMRTKFMQGTAAGIATDATVMKVNQNQTIETITAAAEGQIIYIIGLANNSTVVQSGNIRLRDASNYAITTGKTLTLMYVNALWYELARSDA